ncbi:ATP-binding protein [uncultured Brevundimonas sp.]|uniref:ATP-binding protein n=1 Tax=uncultured Brevundimonas sp. TaxID=213418 RepID=UPI0030EDE089
MASDEQPESSQPDEIISLEVKEELSAWLANPDHDGQVVKTSLRPSDRVIARVTDGIYRQPASALRELISNAWDADAKNVTILTDAPRFSRIYVRDDGLGMSHQTLTRLLKSIGGSAKRREIGQELGVTHADDVELTPGGRKIIGKIGIGLFSVSQLAKKFEIITKVAGADYRLVAEIRLNQFDDDAEGEGDDEHFLAGEVFIRREHSDDIAAHGTDIILNDIKPRVRDILRSADRWDAVHERDEALRSGDIETYASLTVERPRFHSGYTGPVQDGGISVLVEEPRLPWTANVPPDQRMVKLIEAVEGEFSRLARPDLANTLDTYLEMIWSLGLSASVPYVDCHPFDLVGGPDIQFFWLAGSRGKGAELNVADGEMVRDAVRRQVKGAPELVEGRDPVGGFDVNIDGLSLRRPIRFDHRQSEARGLAHSVMFLGRFEPDLTQVTSRQRGGDLNLEGYLFWTGRIIPKENNGVLVRIRGASGALFDPTFFKYQVSEQTRLRQITSEIFVQSGLDPALNIDRESFNFSHPHVQMLTLWLHSGLKQLTNRLKDLAQRNRQSRRAQESVQAASAVAAKGREVWHAKRGDAPVPSVQFTINQDEAQKYREQGSIVFSPSVVSSAPTTKGGSSANALAEALITVLTAYGVFEDRTYEEQQALVEAILSVFAAESL